MATGISLFFLAVGAILTFAIETSVSGVDLDTIGVILMVIGLLGHAVLPGAVGQLEPAELPQTTTSSSAAGMS